MYMATRTRSYRVTLDLSLDEQAVLKSLSKRLGISMQDVLRMALLKLNERGGA
jgi:hypothetical protein